MAVQVGFQIQHITTVAVTTICESDLLKVFSLSSEYKHFKVRGEENIELSKLLKEATISVNETVDQPSAKVNLLLQVYVNQHDDRLSISNLLTDMSFDVQYLFRLIRAMIEYATYRRSDYPK